ncbi:hypothetical protein RHMOL_Rhmol02G0246800 [Rhododendron molle]|uniref:Uncharacterized protein n=1 Tax=Rhododendron molle TaxID=49168 RepID=A0ACC0PTF4_RHOML|nr:hypothetical protein RHMOL_Rhmol02G0246800 [Rhododendron molle]
MRKQSACDNNTSFYVSRLRWPWKEGEAEHYRSFTSAQRDCFSRPGTASRGSNGWSSPHQTAAWTLRSSPSPSSVTSVRSNYSALRWIASGGPLPPNPSEISGKDTKVSMGHATFDRGVNIISLPLCFLLIAFLILSKVEQVAEEAGSLKESLDMYFSRNQRRTQEARERAELLGRANGESSHVLRIFDEEAQAMQSARNSSRMLEESYATGVAILGQYAGQRDRLKSAQRKALDVLNSVGTSNFVLRLIERRHRVDRWIKYVVKEYKACGHLSKNAAILYAQRHDSHHIRGICGLLVFGSRSEERQGLGMAIAISICGFGLCLSAIMECKVNCGQVQEAHHLAIPAIGIAPLTAMFFMAVC